MARFFGKVFHFFVYSNLFIAACAILMASQTYQLLLGKSPDFDFLGFVFFSTICSYSFHWYLTTSSEIPSHRLEWLKPNLFVHIALFILGLVGAAYYFFVLISYWPWLMVGAFITFLYSAPKIPHPYFRALRKIAIGKTIFLAAVWTYVTTVLPVMVSDGEINPAFLLFVASRFFLIYAICILFDYRDREDDRVKGIRSLITFMNEKGIGMLFFSSLAIFAISTVLLLYFSHSLLTICLLLIPGLITALLYNHARRNFSDILYYFVLDGLMALSSVLTLISGN